LSYPDVPIYDIWAENALVAVGFSTVGAVISSRRHSENRIGWIFCIIGLLGGVRLFSAEYAADALLAEPGLLPAGELLAWITGWIWIPHIGLLGFLGLLFPNGQLPSRRWKYVAWSNAIVLVIGAALTAFSPGPVRGLGPIQNPLGTERIINVVDLVEALVYGFMIFAAVSLFVRRLRARGVERQQLKWFTYSCTVGVCGAILNYVLSPVIGGFWFSRVGFMLIVVALLGIPISMGIAILRYRLYEIDLIINKTLVYGSLTATLGLAYFGSVTTLQYLFSLLTGQGNTLAIVASTLAIAALFNPLRRRIQGFIDRRFYRRKYDARKTLEAFGSRLRYETDLERISEDLLEVVDETMQPSHISLWLRYPSSPKRSEGSSIEVGSSMQSEPPPPQHPQ
jgi:hypothetical protein